jgi:hypothetical protein
VNVTASLVHGAETGRIGSCKSSGFPDRVVTFVGKFQYPTGGIMLRRSAGAAVAAAASGMLLTATAASATTAHIQITDATLAAKGAAVSVTASYRCPVGEQGYVDTTLSQVGSRHVVNQGYGSAQVTCTGKAQTATFLVTSYGVYKRGDAAAVADLYTCTLDYSTCTSVTSDQVVQLHK